MKTPSLLALLATSILFTHSAPAQAEGSPADLTLALSAAKSHREYVSFVSFFTGPDARCRVEQPSVEKISYVNHNKGDNEAILVIQKLSCPGVDGRPISRPAIVISVDLWRANVGPVKPDSPFTVIQEVKVIKTAN